MCVAPPSAASTPTPNPHPRAGEAPADGPEPAPRPLAPLRVITAHYYLEDTYPELGPTFFIAGSHLAGRPPRESDQSAYNGMPDQSLLVKAGDCVLFRSDVCKARTLRPCAPPFYFSRRQPQAHRSSMACACTNLQS